MIMTSFTDPLVERSLKSVWHPCTQMQHHETFPLIALKKGQGPWLFDSNNHRFFDGISSWWTNLFGHANPRINLAIKKQLDTLEHAMLAGFTHEPVVSLSEKLILLTKNHLGHVFYASDGASAIEIALKMSYHFWKNKGFPEKSEFVCLKGSYHGETLGALSVTNVELFHKSYEPLLHPVHIISSPDNRKGENTQEIVETALLELENLLKARAHKIAAFILEPLIQCATGFVMYDASYLTKAKALCEKYQVHFIADEIAVGCGRTGTFFACEQAQIWPDFLTLSKGISAGYLPLSLVMTTDAIYQTFYDEDYTKGFLHSHSYTGNPLACTAALATLSIFEDDNILEQNKEKAALLTKALEPIATHERVRHFRHLGMIWAFDVDLKPHEQTHFSRQFFTTGIKNEILLRPINNTVYLMPPYVLTKTDIQFLAMQTFITLNQVLQS